MKSNNLKCYNPLNIFLKNKNLKTKVKLINFQKFAFQEIKYLYKKKMEKIIKLMQKILLMNF